MNLYQPEKSRPLLRRLWTPHFVVTVAVLVGAAILAGPVAWSMNFRQGKAAIPLRKPLGAMDVEKLRPYRVVERLTLDPVVVEALRTDQYIHWVVEDDRLLPDDPLRQMQLFMTYDTGGVNVVPHVPDECRLGAGYQPARPHENRDVRIATLADAREVPLRVCTFVKTAVFQRHEQTVVYLFHSNGDFAATREGVRLLFNDPRDRFAYFCKVEMSFPRANREQSVEGAARFLQALLPVLLSDHLPDVDAAGAASSG